jgi:hypothetical protein
MKDDAVPCMCIAEFCEHKNEPCKNPAKFSFPIRTGTNESTFGPERRIGICEVCWQNIEKQHKK